MLAFLSKLEGLYLQPSLAIYIFPIMEIHKLQIQTKWHQMKMCVRTVMKPITYRGISFTHSWVQLWVTSLSQGGMSVVRVQASALDIESDVTIQRYSFFEIQEIILNSCNDNHMYIFRILFFWVALLFPVSIIPWTCNYNSRIRISKHVFKIFHFQSLQLTIKSTFAHW